MLEWLLRGLRRRPVTIKYPHNPEPAPYGFQGPVTVTDVPRPDPGIEDLCPTRAISVGEHHRYVVDRSRCIGCGACVRQDPTRFRFDRRFETASRTRQGLIVDGDRTATSAAVEPTRAALGDQVRALRRSVHIRHVDAGSDGAEEWEIQALTNPYYDMQRLGLFLTASPRHADVLLVTGGVTAPMRDPLLRTYAVMPTPKAVVAVGTDACSGGLSAELGTTLGGVDRLVPVDVYVPGSPPSPLAILHGLLLAVGVLREATS